MKELLLISLLSCSAMVFCMDKSGDDTEDHRKIMHYIVDANHEDLSEFLKDKKNLIDQEIITLAHHLASFHHNASHPAVKTQGVVDIASGNTVDINEAMPSIGIFFASYY